MRNLILAAFLDPFELPYVIGLFAANRVADDKTSIPEVRAGMIELGLQADEADQLQKRVKKFYAQRGLRDPFSAAE